MAGSQVVRNAAASASLNILLQICGRVATFVLNAFTLRYIERAVLGVINVRLMLIYSTIQFMSREAFRRTAISDSKTRKWQEVVNMVWMSVPVSLIIGSLLSFVWIKALHNPDPEQVPGYDWAVVLMTCSVVIEMTAEPFYVFGQLRGLIKLRVVIEAIALIVRCLIMAVLVVRYSRDAVLVFALAQLVSSLIYTLSYWIYFRFIHFRVDVKDEAGVKSIGHFMPKLDSQPFLNRSLLTLTWSFQKQSLVKQLLTEGEKFVMTFFNPLSFGEQGIYEVVNNLGSLAARFILQPIEESSYLLFSQFLDRNKSASKQNAVNLTTVKDVLCNILRIMFLLGFFVVAFGYNYSELALHLYGGSNLSQGIGPLLLRWHCIYILVIAVNGVTECFTFAAMDKNHLDQFNRQLVFLSVILLSSAYLLTLYMGSQGFIVANCLNMIGRIVFSFYFIGDYFREANVSNPLLHSLPKWKVIGSFAACFLCLRCSEMLLCCETWLQSLLHVVVGVLLLPVIALVIYLQETNLLLFVKSHWKQRGEGGKSE